MTKFEEEYAREEPEVTVVESEYSFMPPITVMVEYPAVKGTSGTKLHLTPQGALQLYTKLGEFLRSEEQI